MIDLIGQRDIKKIMNGEYDFSAKDENYLKDLRISEEEKKERIRTENIQI